ncbi:hypothetical protein B0H13DRAFT_1713163 [Mycena leptocephala]|nr:hypothetical protein B0H13DRAFT_1713163 [Mycena leptocephala]
MLVYALLSLAAARLPLFSSIAVVSAASPTLNFASSNQFGYPPPTRQRRSHSGKTSLHPWENPPSRRDYHSAVETMNLYVNGDYIGSGSTPRRSGFAQRFCVDLLPSLNVFAVNASTAPANLIHGALVATILVTYSDGTADTLVTDSSWRMAHGSPAGFEQPSFNDTTWAAATVVGTGSTPFGEVIIPANPPVTTLDLAQWVWTNAIPAGGNLPNGSRAFRRTFTPAPGQTPRSANILITADNAYTLYVNGVSIGSGNNWPVAQHYVVNFGTATSEIVLAVLATNIDVTPAGILLEMEVNMQPSGPTNCIAGSIVSSDGGWKSTLGAIPAGFEQPGFDDSTWPLVANEGVYGVGPWGILTIQGASAPITI